MAGQGHLGQPALGPGVGGVHGEDTVDDQLLDGLVHAVPAS
jgi:hypothetical protein